MSGNTVACLAPPPAKGVELLLNGRFLARSTTGVERVAIELTRALRLLSDTAADTDLTLSIAVPADMVLDKSDERIVAAGLPEPDLHVIGKRSGHFWEQAELPWFKPGSWLLSLCNVGPLARRRQCVIIHDAQFIVHPESYSVAFRWWYRMLLTALSRRAAVVCTVSNFSKQSLERHGLAPPGKVEVLRLGTDHIDRLDPDAEVLARHRIEASKYVLAIGSLARHKNLITLVEAFIAAAMPDVTLVIAGGADARVFRNIGLPSAPNVRYIGRVSDAELKALYEGALAFACPSYSEGFGLTPLEAMSVGCPVLATTGGAVPEVCADAVLYADPHDPSAWSAALRRLVDDSDLRADLSARGRARAAQFRWHDTAEQLLRILRKQDGQ